MKRSDSIEYLKDLNKRYKKLQGYDDGGDVKTDDNSDNDDSILTKISKAIKEGFEGSPAPTPSPTPSREEEYEKIREEQEADRNRKASDYTQPGMSRGGKVKSLEKPHNSKNLENLKKTLGKFLSEEGTEGEHNKKNIQSLKKAFNSFLSEEEKQKYFKGGKVKGYDDGGDVSANADDQDIAVGYIENPGSPDSTEALANNAVFSPIDTGALQETLEDQQESPISDQEAEDVSGGQPAVIVGRTPASEQSMEETPSEEDEEQRLKDIADTSGLDLSNGDEEDQEVPQTPQEQQATTIRPGEEDEDITPSMTVAQQGVPQPDDFQQRLAQAQSQRAGLLGAQQGAMTGALLAAGIAGHGATPANPVYFQGFRELAQLPVQNIVEQTAMEKQDPNSAVSKFYRDYLVNKMGVNPDSVSGVSADGLEKLFPQVTRIIGGQFQQAIVGQRIQAQKDIAANRINAQLSIADLNNSTRLQAAKMLEDAAEGRYDNRIIQSLAEKSLDYGPVKQGVQAKFALANSLNSVNDNNVPLTPQVLYDAQKNLTLALSGRPGGATQQQINSMVINPMESKLKKFEQSYLSMSPEQQADMRNTETGQDMIRFINGFGQSIDQQLDRDINAAQQAYTKNAIGAFKSNPKISGALSNISGGAPVNIKTGGNSSKAPIGNVSASTLQQYAKKHNMSVDQSATFLKGQGYAVEGY